MGGLFLFWTGDGDSLPRGSLQVREQGHLQAGVRPFGVMLRCGSGERVLAERRAGNVDAVLRLVLLLLPRTCVLASERHIGAVTSRL